MAADRRKRGRAVPARQAPSCAVSWAALRCSRDAEARVRY